LNWMMFKTNLHIEHALNGGEVSVVVLFILLMKFVLPIAHIMDA
jgi:hypothetical protein